MATPLLVTARGCAKACALLHSCRRGYGAWQRPRTPTRTARSGCARLRRAWPPRCARGCLRPRRAARTPTAGRRLPSRLQAIGAPPIPRSTAPHGTLQHGPGMARTARYRARSDCVWSAPTAGTGRTRPAADVPFLSGPVLVAAPWLPVGCATMSAMNPLSMGTCSARRAVPSCAHANTHPAQSPAMMNARSAASVHTGGDGVRFGRER